MVHGLNHFARYFSDLKSEYVIVGGTASTILLEDAGIKFRATKDIDLVIIATDTDKFAEKMIQYVRDGLYQVQEKNDGSPRFYRFKKPRDPAFPVQVEIFHKKPDGIELFEGQHIIPIKAPNEDLGISAILLNREYFELIRENTNLNGMIPITSTLATIVL
ncbi:MAG: hypothetical protein ACOH5I_01630 [Oligoflexus sp.]